MVCTEFIARRYCCRSVTLATTFQICVIQYSMCLCVVTAFKTINMKHLSFLFLSLCLYLLCCCFFLACIYTVVSNLPRVVKQTYISKCSVCTHAWGYWINWIDRHHNFLSLTLFEHFLLRFFFSISWRETDDIYAWYTRTINTHTLCVCARALWGKLHRSVCM